MNVKKRMHDLYELIQKLVDSEFIFDDETEYAIKDAPTIQMKSEVKSNDNM